MPKFLVPHKSGAHRIAGIALFRALLVQCQRVPLSGSPAANAELQNVVRNRFKQARHITSYRQLRTSFDAGYEAIDHLDAAVAGSADAKDIISALLAKASRSAKRPPRPPHNKAIDKKLKRQKELAERPPRMNMFDRPLPLEQLSGERKVPVLFTANHIPILRFTKPQPSSLSGYITNRIVQRQKRHDRKHALEEALVLAEDEDRWDSIVHQFSGVDGRKPENWKGSPVRESLWRDAVIEALGVVKAALEREKELNRIMAEKMQGVVDRETALADKERQEREEREERESAKLAVYQKIG